MITLQGYPKNKDKFIRLMDFFKETLGLCQALNMAPILDGSLAVFAYTRNPEMNVNDVDLSSPEAEFPKVIKILEAKGVSYKLREWHVLQILRDDLKIELGSLEYWYKDLPVECDRLHLDDYRIKVLSLRSLTEFYKRGMEDRAKQTSENEKIKYEALKVKYEALKAVDRASNGLLREAD